MIGVDKVLGRTRETKHFRSQMAVGLRKGQRKRVAQQESNWGQGNKEKNRQGQRGNVSKKPRGGGASKTIKQKEVNGRPSRSEVRRQKSQYLPRQGKAWEGKSRVLPDTSACT